MLVNELHRLNAPSRMLVILFGILTLVNVLHPLKAKAPIVVNWLSVSKLTLVSAVQFWKASCEIHKAVLPLYVLGIVISPDMSSVLLG